MSDLVTLNLVVFGKSLKFDSHSCDLASNLKKFEQLINEPLRKLHRDVPVPETFDGSPQELFRIFWSEEVDTLECELFKSHWDELSDHLSTTRND